MRVALDDVCDIITDGTHASPERVDAGVPVLSAQNVQLSGLDMATSRFTSDAELAAFERRFRPRRGDVLMTIVGTIGRVTVLEEAPRAVFQRSVAFLRPNDGVLDSRYLALVSQSPDFRGQLARATNQSSQAGVYLSRLKAIEVPLPTLGEQRRIAATLDHVDALRAKRRQILAHLDTLTQSIFHDLFCDVRTNERGWAAATVDDVAERVTDGEHKTPRRSDTGIPLLSARNVRDGWIDFENTDFIDEEEYAKLSRRIEPRAGDVLISCSGTIGRVAQVRERARFAMVRSAALVRPDASVVHPTFLETALATPAMRATMLGQANSSAQANLFQNQIKRLPMVVPPLHLQHDLVTRVDAVNAQRDRVRRAQVVDDRLFASLQSRAFRGEL